MNAFLIIFTKLIVTYSYAFRYPRCLSFRSVRNNVIKKKKNENLQEKFEKPANLSVLTYTYLGLFSPQLQKEGSRVNRNFGYL